MTDTNTAPGPRCISEHQWRTLLAIADGFVGSSTASGSASLPSKFELASPSGTPAFRASLSNALDVRVPQQARDEIGLFLTLIGGIGGYILNAHSGYLYDLTRQEVEEVIQGWQASRLAPIRTGAKGVGQIVRSLWLRYAPGVLEYMGAPALPVPPVRSEAETIDGGATPQSVLEAAAVQVYDDEEVLVLETEILVVGSGSGASAFTHSLARALTESGYHFSAPTRSADILILERGKAFAPRAAGHPLPDNEAESFEQMFTEGGVSISKESGITVLSANTLGGGSRINWSACLQVERRVREEWTAHMRKGAVKGTEGYADMFTGPEWQDCLETVESNMGVKSLAVEDHNLANRVLLDGARRMGYAVKSVPQNIAGSFQAHAQCGAYCTTGCRIDDGSPECGGKMSGCRFALGPLSVAKEGMPVVKTIADFEVDRVVFSGEKAVGAIGTALVRGERRKVMVKAVKTVVAAGTMQTPAVLLRSGITNPHLGRHLHLHPVVLVHSTWPADVNPWEGTILTTAITEFSDLDGLGHGVKLEAMCMTPMLNAAYLPWSSSQDWKERLRLYPRTMGHIVLCRERDTGNVHLGKNGMAEYSYVPSAFDRANIMKGVEALAKLLYAMGAETISTNTAGAPTWRRSGADDTHTPFKTLAKQFDRDMPPTDTRKWSPMPLGDDVSFNKWLQETTSLGNDLSRTSYGSAHQMGTCRMASSPAHGAVDPRGKVWGKSGLYVSDASLFPSASGVNPMITTMGFGEWVGRRVGEEMVSEQTVNQGEVRAKL